MKKVWANYKATIILICSIIIGSIIGIIFGEKAKVLSPLGDIFIHLLFIIIVPLIFLTITTSIVKMDNPKRLGKIIKSIIIVFIMMSFVSALIGIIVTRSFNLVEQDKTKVLDLLDDNEVIETDLSLLERTANLLTVSDFNQLLSKDNIIALLVFSMIFGFATRKAKEKAEPVIKFLIALNDIVLNIITIIMYYAPIGLGCYIAALIGNYGSYIAVGFLKTFIIYTVTCLFVYFIVYSLYALVSGGKKTFFLYWKNILPPTVTALATCSSAASIPVNIASTKKMGISDDIVETTIPLGTSFHKEGSVIGSVFKIMFLVYLFNFNSSFWSIFSTSIIVTLLVSAVPIGGGTISEMMIISLMGFPASALPILTIIATVIDAPATMLNVVGESSSSLLVSRLIDGKINFNGKE